MTVRLLVADDHQILRSGLVKLLADEGFTVVAEADNGRDAIELAVRHRPDVAILDVTMPGINGVEAARRIRAEVPEVRVLALSMHADARFVTEMFQAGASGYLLKMCAFEELAGAVRTVAGGGEYVGAEIAGAALRQLAGRVPPEAADGLSDREREVLQMLAEGKSSKEIAFDLKLSTKTVDTHRRQVMEKLGFRSLAELTKYAIRQGLTPLEE